MWLMFLINASRNHKKRRKMSTFILSIKLVRILIVFQVFIVRIIYLMMILIILASTVILSNGSVR